MKFGNLSIELLVVKMFPPSKDPYFLLVAARDWKEDAEERLEVGRVKQAQESLQEAILTYSQLPPGYKDLDLEEQLVKLSSRVYNRLNGKLPL